MKHMLDKQVTRKQFLLSIGSVVGLIAMSGVPKILTGSKENKNTDQSSAYGNQSYGGKSA